jgi:hypothetical protein
MVYLTVIRDDSSQLDDEVSRLISHGWLLTGSVSITKREVVTSNGNTTVVTYAQTLIKPDEPRR